MKVQVLKENMKDGLAAVERVASRSLSLPILSNILLSAKGNALEFAATDLEIGVRLKTLARVEEEGAVLVPSRFLSGFIGLLADSQITLHGGQKTLHVEAKSQHTTVKTLNPDDFPIIPSVGTNGRFEVSCQNFCRGLSQVVGVASQGQARPEITGVFVAFEKDAARMAATDSYRLAERTLRFEKPAAHQADFILPQKAARELVAILADKPGRLRITVSSSQAGFVYENQDSPFSVELVSRLIDGEYPNYRDVIPEKSETTAVLARAELVNQIRTASVFANKMSELKFRLAPKTKEAQLSTANADLGEHSSQLPAEGTGGPSEASFNWRFFLEGVAQARADSVRIGMNGEDGPATIRPAQEDGYLYVLMPIRAS